MMTTLHGLVTSFLQDLPLFQKFSGVLQLLILSCVQTFCIVWTCTVYANSSRVYEDIVMSLMFVKVTDNCTMPRCSKLTCKAQTEDCTVEKNEDGLERRTIRWTAVVFRQRSARGPVQSSCLSWTGHRLVLFAERRHDNWSKLRKTPTLRRMWYGQDKTRCSLLLLLLLL